MAITYSPPAYGSSLQALPIRYSPPIIGDTPSTTALPIISPIPVVVLAPGETDTISLDTYVSGDVNDDGITISGEPSWITISTLDLNDPNARGVNRTISIAPPTSITASDQFAYTLSVVGSGGTTTQTLTVYVDVPFTPTPTPTPPPVISNIPMSILAPGETDTISLDDFVSGDGVEPASPRTPADLGTYDATSPGIRTLPTFSGTAGTVQFIPQGITGSGSISLSGTDADGNTFTENISFPQTFRNLISTTANPLRVFIAGPYSTGTFIVKRDNSDIIISDNESWITLSDGETINRTITISPPTSITTSTQYDYLLTVGGTGGVTRQTLSVYVDVPTTLPTPPTPPPVIAPIPIQVLAPGTSSVIALDAFVSGMVNDDGIAISGEPSWVMLGAGMGVNRSITTSPPTSITTSTQFGYVLTATGPGGSTTQVLTVYVDVAGTTPTTEFEMSWDVPDGSIVTSADPNDVPIIVVITPAITNTEAQLRSTTDRIVEIDGINLDVDDMTNVEIDIDPSVMGQTTITFTIKAPRNFDGSISIGIDDDKLTT